MALFMVGAGDDESKGAADSKGKAAPNSTGPEGPRNGSTASAAAQAKNPAALADLVRLGNYPNGGGPVDVFGALRGRGYAVIEADLGALAGVLIREDPAGVVILSSAVTLPERTWAAAVLLYKALAVRSEGPDVVGLPEGALQNDSYQVNAETFAAALLMPEREVRKVWEREAKDAYQTVKILAGVFAVPEVRARTRAVELGLIAPDAKPSGKPRRPRRKK